MRLLWQMFLSFLKIGAFTIGGGYAMLSVIENEVVAKRGWVAQEDFLDMVVLAQTAPGVLAMNISILVGQRIAGRWGALVGALGSALPSFVIILVFAIFLNEYQDNVYVMKAFRAIRPAVVALIAVPVFKLGKSAHIGWRTVIIPVVAAIAIWLLGVSPIYIVLIAVLSGLVWRWVELYRNGKEEGR